MMERRESGDGQDMALKGRLKKVSSPSPRKTRRRLLFDEREDEVDNESDDEDESEEEKTSVLDDGHTRPSMEMIMKRIIMRMD